MRIAEAIFENYIRPFVIQNNFIDRYYLVEELGHGSAAKVYKGTASSDVHCLAAKEEALEAHIQNSACAESQGK